MLEHHPAIAHRSHAYCKLKDQPDAQASYQKKHLNVIKCKGLYFVAKLNRMYQDPLTEIQNSVVPGLQIICVALLTKWLYFTDILISPLFQCVLHGVVAAIVFFCFFLPLQFDFLSHHTDVAELEQWWVG